MGESGEHPTESIAAPGALGANSAVSRCARVLTSCARISIHFLIRSSNLSLFPLTMSLPQR